MMSESKGHFGHERPIPILLMTSFGNTLLKIAMTHALSGQRVRTLTTRAIQKVISRETENSK